MNSLLMITRSVEKEEKSVEGYWSQLRNFSMNDVLIKLKIEDILFVLVIGVQEFYTITKYLITNTAL